MTKATAKNVWLTHLSRISLRYISTFVLICLISGCIHPITPATSEPLDGADSVSDGHSTTASQTPTVDGESDADELSEQERCSISAPLVAIMEQEAPTPAEAEKLATEVASYIDTGMAYVNKNDGVAALREFELALPLYVRLGEIEYAAILLNLMGQLHHVYSGDLENARLSFCNALRFAQSVKNAGEGVRALQGLGYIALTEEKPKSALTHFEAVLAIVETMGLPEQVFIAKSSVASATIAVASAAQADGHLVQALDANLQALDIYRTIDDPQNEALTLNDIGQLYMALHHYQEAQFTYGELLDICPDINNPQCEISALNNLAEAFDAMGRYSDALTSHEKALTECEAFVNCAEFEATIRHNLGRTLLQVGNYEEAKDQLDDALVLASKYQLSELQGNALNSLGNLQMAMGHYNQALSALQDALNIFELMEHDVGIADTLNNIGQLFHRQGLYQQASEQYTLALNTIQADMEPASVATTQANLAALLESQARYEDALRMLEKSTTLYNSIGELDGQASNSNIEGRIFDSIGDYNRAIQSYQRALELTKSSGQRSRSFAALNNIGATYMALGAYDAGLATLQDALYIAEQMERPSLIATALNNLGVAHANLNQYETALTYYQKAQAIQQTLDDRSGEGTTIANMSLVYAEQGNLSQALDTYSTALAIFRETDERSNEAQILTNIGRLYHREGNLGKAIEYYTEAVTIGLTVQQEIRVEEFAASFANTQAQRYDWLIEALIAHGDPETAFNMAEQARAQAFLTQIRNQLVDLRLGLDSELVVAEQALYQQIVGLQSAIDAERAKANDLQNRLLLRQMSQELELVRNKYQELLTRLKLVSPAYTSLVSVEPSALSEVQTELLDAQTSLIEFHVTDEHIFVWVIDKTEMTLVTLERTTKDLLNRISYARDLIGGGNLGPEISSALYESLFAPLVPHIRNNNLIVAPHDVLHYLPFATLWSKATERYLIEEYVLRYTPSASVLKYIGATRNEDQGHILVMGNPDGSLPNAEAEVASIAKLYSSVSWIKRDATESKVYEQASEIDILHLAAHGVYEQFTPLFSRLELGSDEYHDGKLEVHEVFGLDLSNAKLVVLSACETALGAQSNGDEIVGLTRAFLYAGSPNVISTLWSVSDVSTAFLMEHFYTYLRNGVPIADSLRQAQLDTLSEYPAPYHWGAFILHGDGR